jgi:hypothetical protein
MTVRISGLIVVQITCFMWDITKTNWFIYLHQPL